MDATETTLIDNAKKASQFLKVMANEHRLIILCALAQGEIAGRQDDLQVTLFKSVGIAAQDAVAARVAVSTALKRGIGQTVDW